VDLSEYIDKDDGLEIEIEDKGFNQLNDGAPNFRVSLVTKDESLSLNES
jgi:hypothetical protein